MAKPKSPLLSLGARGTIGNTLTFQKRGSLTIARRKPIPTDPKTDLQLAQRQVYRDAVAAWNALTPEEKEAYRGVCPGLTPYQCYMRTALVPAPPPPPPVEQTEEQTQYDVRGYMYAADWYRRGQKLTIANREVTKLGFWLNRVGSPAGNVVFAIRKVSDDSLICSKTLGDASEISLEITYYEVTFDPPPTINEEVRIYAEYQGGNAPNNIAAYLKKTDVKSGENYSAYKAAGWTDVGTYDCAYRYKYYEV